MQQVVINTETTSQVGKYHALAFKYNDMRCSANTTSTLSPIIRLLLACSPTTVARFVVSVVINAVQFVIRCWLRPSSHISEKVFKRITPALADYNPAPTVISVTRRCHTVASVLHGPPSLVFRAVFLSVCSTALTCNLSTQASTTQFVSPSQCGASGDNVCCSAIARARPLNQLPLISTSKVIHCKTTESASDKIFNSVVESRQRGGRAKMYFSHEKFLSSEGCLWLEPAGVDSASSARFIIPPFSKRKEVPRGF